MKNERDWEPEMRLVIGVYLEEQGWWVTRLNAVVRRSRVYHEVFYCWLYPGLVRRQWSVYCVVHLLKRWQTWSTQNVKNPYHLLLSTFDMCGWRNHMIQVCAKILSIKVYHSLALLKWIFPNLAQELKLWVAYHMPLGWKSTQTSPKCNWWRRKSLTWISLINQLKSHVEICIPCFLLFCEVYVCLCLDDFID